MYKFIYIHINKDEMFTVLTLSLIPTGFRSLIIIYKFITYDTHS